MKRDVAQRASLARVDDKQRRSKVSQARKHIYDKNYAVNSEAVEVLLRPQSLVPTAVCQCYLIFKVYPDIGQERVLGQAGLFWLQSL